MSKRTAVMWQCDNPECDAEEEEFAPGMAFGFFITKGVHHNGMGGRPIPKTFACSAGCIAPAVEFRIREEDR